MKESILFFSGCIITALHFSIHFQHLDSEGDSDDDDDDDQDMMI